jgi:hypothetical protein|tara:strand:- start:235 stop:387 length:153 start_codon:yes stop_codon:yes gene_type:complete
LLNDVEAIAGDCRRLQAIAGDFQADYLNARMDVSSLHTHIYGLARAREGV